MPRDVFPHEDDRRVIRDFLRGEQHPLNNSWLLSTAGGLTYNHSSCAFFDTAGALLGKLAPGINLATNMRIIDEISKQLGMGTTVVREWQDEFVPTGSGVAGTTYVRHFNYFFDGNPVQVDQPFVIMGALGMSAWRECNK